jgi:asparagine synthase (glutamine-hydrolysing)
MCGISVVIDAGRERVERALARMNDAQRHRGPDDDGLHLAELPDGRVVGLGFRRLAIQDLSEHGHQPMLHARSGRIVVFNGEIYNFRELRRELEGYGHRFRGHSDTEVILAGYDEWGAQVFPRLAGMFAIALWDPVESALTIARDPIGIKPLYVARTSGGWAMASEIRALRASGLVSDEIDRGALATFLAYGAVQEPRTILTAAQPLAAGSLRRFAFRGDRFQASDERFWHFPSVASGARFEEGASDLGNSLRTAVSDHLVADVPVGVLLSRGVDSTTLLKLATEVRPGDIDAFTVSVGQGTDLDEAPIAAETARLYGARFHRVTVDDRAASEAFSEWLATMDQPTIDGLNTLVVSKAVKRAGITVALSGLGADELFGGYGVFRSGPRLAYAARAMRLAPHSLGQGALRWASRALIARPKSIKLLEAVLARDGSSTAVALAHRRLLSDAHLRALGLGTPRELGLSDDWLPERHEAHERASAGGTEAVRYAECVGYMRNTLLRDSDVFGMATSLELRVPFLDQRVLDRALRLPLPPARRQPSKASVVQRLVGALPDAVVRRRKQGFVLDHDRFARDVDAPALARAARVLGASTAPWIARLDVHRRTALWLAGRILGAT